MNHYAFTKGILRMNPRYILLLMLLTLGACGFHLRGTQVNATKVGVSAIAVKSLSAQQVADQVISQLQLGGTKIINATDKKAHILTLRNEGFVRDMLSVSADTGKVKEYQLTFHVIMSLSGPGAKLLVNNETIEVSRDYTFDESSILGKSNEEASLREDLIRQVSAQIVRRVNAVMK